FQAEDGIRDDLVTGVQTCALPIWGTGGHVIPALAIAQELQKLYQAEVLFIGTARGLENKLVPPTGFPLRLVEVGALNRVSLGTRSEERRVGKEGRSEGAWCVEWIR